MAKARCGWTQTVENRAQDIHYPTDHLVQPHIPHKVGSGSETSRIQIGTRDNNKHDTCMSTGGETI